MSIGQGCVVPEILRDNGLRLMAGPLDWTFAKNYSTTIKILKNRFKDYFVKENLVSNGYDKFNNTYSYSDSQTGLMHPHSFPAIEDFNFDKAYQAALDTYIRRIKYFYDFIEAKYSRICLIYVERNYDWQYKNDYSVQTEVSNKILSRDISELNNIYGKKCFDILYIKHNAKLKMNEYKVNGRIIEVNNTCIFEKDPCRGNLPMLKKIINKNVGISLGVIIKELMKMFNCLGFCIGSITAVKNRNCLFKK